MSKKKSGKISFFSQFVKNLIGKKIQNNNLSLSFQEVSDDKYLKLYKIKSI